MSPESEEGQEVGAPKYRGVYETSWGGRWFAQIRRDGKLRYLGTYPTPEDARDAYLKASEILG